MNTVIKTITPKKFCNFFTFRRYLKQFLTCKKNVKTYEKLHKPPKKVTPSFPWNNKRQTDKIAVQQLTKPRRYQPVAERWSDIAFKKSKDKISNHVNKPGDKSMEYDYEESAISTNLHNVNGEKQKEFLDLKNSKLTQDIPKSNKSKKQEFYENNAKASDAHISTKTNDTVFTNEVRDEPLEDKKRNMKKSVRFDNNLCSFAPTPEGFHSSTEQLSVDGNLSSIKANASECEIQFDQIIKNYKTGSIENSLKLSGNSINKQIENVSARKVFLTYSKEDEISNPTTESKNDQKSLKSYVIEPYSELDFIIEDSSSSPSNLEVQVNKVHTNITDTTEQVGTSTVSLDKTEKELVVYTNLDGSKTYEGYKPKLKEIENKNDDDELSQDIHLRTHKQLMTGTSLTSEPVIIEATPSTEELLEEPHGNTMSSAAFGDYGTDTLNEAKNKTSQTEAEKYEKIDKEQIPLTIFENSRSIQENNNDITDIRLTNFSVFSPNRVNEENLETAKVNFNITSPTSSTSDRDYISDESQNISNSCFEKKSNQDKSNNNCIDQGIKRLMISECKSPIKVLHESQTNRDITEMSENKNTINNQNITVFTRVNSGSLEPEHSEHCTTTYETTPISQLSSNLFNQAAAKLKPRNKLEITVAPSEKDTHHISIEPSIKRTLFPMANIQPDYTLMLEEEINDKFETECVTFETSHLLAISESEDLKNELSTGEKENPLRNMETGSNDSAVASCDINDKLNYSGDISNTSMLVLSNEVVKPTVEKYICEKEKSEDVEYFAVSDEEVSSQKLPGMTLLKYQTQIVDTTKENLLEDGSFEKREYFVSKDNIVCCEVFGLASPIFSKDVVLPNENDKHKEESFEETEYLALSNDEDLSLKLSIDDPISSPKVDSFKEISQPRLESFDKSNYEVLSLEFPEVTSLKSPKDIVNSTRTNGPEVRSFEDTKYFTVSNEEILSFDIHCSSRSQSAGQIISPFKHSNKINPLKLTNKENLATNNEKVVIDCNVSSPVESIRHKETEKQISGFERLMTTSSQIDCELIGNICERSKNIRDNTLRTAILNTTNEADDSKETSKKCGTKDFQDSKYFVKFMTNYPMAIESNNYSYDINKTTSSKQHNTLPVESSLFKRDQNIDNFQEYCKEEIRTVDLKQGNNKGKSFPIEHNNSLLLNKNISKSTFNNIHLDVEKDNGTTSKEELGELYFLNKVKTSSEDCITNDCCSRKIYEISQSQTNKANKCSQQRGNTTSSNESAIICCSMESINISSNVGIEDFTKPNTLDKHRVAANNTISQGKTAQVSQSVKSNRFFQLVSEKTPNSLGVITNKIKTVPLSYFNHRVSVCSSPVRIKDHTVKKVQKSITPRNTVNKIMQPSTNIPIHTSNADEILSLYSRGRPHSSPLKLQNLTPITLGQGKKTKQYAPTNPYLEEENGNTNCLPLTSNRQYSEGNITSGSPNNLSNSENNNSPTENVLHSYFDNQTLSFQSKLKNLSRRNEFLNISEDSNDSLSKNNLEKKKRLLDNYDQMSSDDEFSSSKNSTVGTVSSDLEEDISSDHNHSQYKSSKYSSDSIGEERRVQNSTSNLGSHSCSIKSDPTFSSLVSFFS